jgi:hypothetical protein
MEPPSEVKRLVDRIKEQGNSLGKDIEYEYNQTRHQYKNSECGVYSMNFIVELLEGRKSFKKIQAEPIKDESMTRKRDFFYMERGN